MEVKPKQTLSVKVFINSTESINISFKNIALLYILYKYTCIYVQLLKHSVQIYVILMYINTE